MAIFFEERTMKRLMLSLLLALGTGSLALFQQGCGTIHYVVVAAPTPTPSLPNVSRIEARMDNQQSRINNAVQTGNLDESVADGLVENIDTVYQWERAYLQSKNDPYEDLTLAETRWLDRMLDDNSLAIDDAIRRNQAWRRLFRGEGAYRYDFGSVADQRQFIVYLHFRVKEQRQRIDEYERSGQLSAAQCRALRQRVNAVGEMEKGYYRKNGKMALSQSQIRQLKESLERNSKDFKMLEVKHGRPAPLPTPTPQRSFGIGKHQDQNQGDGRKDDRWDRDPKWKKDVENQKIAPPTPTATSVPVFTPTAIPVLQNQNERDRNDRWENRRKGRKDKKGFSHRDEEEKRELDQPAPTPLRQDSEGQAPTPEPSVKQVETPVVQTREETGRNDRSNRNRKGKKDKKNPPRGLATEKQEQAPLRQDSVEQAVTPEPSATPSEEATTQKGDDSDKSKKDDRKKRGKKSWEDSQGQDDSDKAKGDHDKGEKKDSGDSPNQDAPKGQE
jgi:hypothetical protein